MARARGLETRGAHIAQGLFAPVPEGVSRLGDTRIGGPMPNRFSVRLPPRSVEAIGTRGESSRVVIEKCHCPGPGGD